MNTDHFERALRDAAGSADASEELWESIVLRAGRPAGRGRRAAVAIASMAATVALLTVALLLADTNGPQQSGDELNSAPHARLLVLTDAGVLEERSSDGLLVRTIASGFDLPGKGLPTVSVARDGSFALIDRADPTESCGRSARVIDHIDLRTGRVGRLFDGAEPALSPDGTSVAFLVPHASECYVWDAVALGTLDGQELRRWPTRGGETLRAPQWSLDGLRLMVTSFINGPTEVRADGSAAVTVDDGQRVAVPDRAVAHGYIGSDVLASRSTGEGTEIVVVARDRPVVLRTLARIPGAGEDTLTAASNAACRSEEASVLALQQDAGKDSAGRKGTRTLFVLDGGDARRVATDVLAAAWVPFSDKICDEAHPRG